jgi:penicillin-insensitive murein DD-endopeptidase
LSSCRLIAIVACNVFVPVFSTPMCRNILWRMGAPFARGDPRPLTLRHRQIDPRVGKTVFFAAWRLPRFFRDARHRLYAPGKDRIPRTVARPSSDSLVTPLVLLASLLFLGSAPALAQDTAAQEATRRAMVLAQSPPNAAKVLFGRETAPSTGPAQSIGAYERGCLSGAVALPADGPSWQVMRPSRNRAWGHPVLIAFLERLAQKLPVQAGWPGLLVGDIAQPRGGPMLTGHGSHQIGLDADIWLTPMPDRRLSPAERDEISATDVVASNGLAVDAAWTPQHRRLLETVAREPAVARIFVNAAIKRALCSEAGPDRAWLAKIRPWWGHNYHFHIRLACPSGKPECQGQAPPPAGDGCGKELDWWFTEEALHPPPSPPRKPLRLADLPAACAALVVAPPGEALRTPAVAR